MLEERFTTRKRKEKAKKRRITGNVCVCVCVREDSFGAFLILSFCDDDSTDEE